MRSERGGRGQAEDAGGEVEAWEGSSAQLPSAMGMIVQQLGYLLSFFPTFDPSVQVPSLLLPAARCAGCGWAEE